MFLDYFALTAMIVVFLILVYAAIYIHYIPYEMAKTRNHTHQDAIHYGGWLILFTLHAIWPFLWIWASLYKPGVGWNMNNSAEHDNNKEIDLLKDGLSELKEQKKGLMQKLLTGEVRVKV